MSKKLGNYVHPTRSNFPTMPQAMDAPMRIQGEQIKDITELLQGRFTNGANANVEDRTIDAFHNQDFTMGLTTLIGPAIGVIPYYGSNGETPRVRRFQVLNEKSIKFALWFDSAPTGKITVRLEVKGS